MVSFTVDVNEPKSNRPNTMSLVEKRAKELGLCEDFANGKAGSLRSRIVNGVVRGGSKSVLGPRPRMSFSFPIPILHHLELSRVPPNRPFLPEIFLVIYSFTPFILAVHLSIMQVATWVSVSSHASLNLLWVAADNMTLFRGHSFINAARLPAAGI